jgi:ERAP1-like C-terminal domain
VAYEPERLKLLGQWAAQRNSVFTLEDRMGLVSDAMVLAKAGVGATSGALDLIASLKDETERACSGRLIPGGDDERPAFRDRSCLGKHHHTAHHDPQTPLGAS